VELKRHLGEKYQGERKEKERNFIILKRSQTEHIRITDYKLLARGCRELFGIGN
jgi:hypothetical protein